MIQECVKTETKNKRYFYINESSLELMQYKNLEEIPETTAKHNIVGPKIKYSSINGITTITFENMNKLPAVFDNKFVQCKQHKNLLDKEKPICVITGKPARYRDPETMEPYYDLEAYKKLKSRK